MTLRIELPPEKEAEIKARAAAEGVTIEEWCRKAMDDRLGGPLVADERPITDVIQQIWADTPEDVLAKLPKDGAAEHDHYIYGWPKKGA